MMNWFRHNISNCTLSWCTCLALCLSFLVSLTVAKAGLTIPALMSWNTSSASNTCCRPVRTAPEMAAASEEHTERLSPSSTANAVVMGRRDNAIVTGQAFCLSALTSIWMYHLCLWLWSSSPHLALGVHVILHKQPRVGLEHYSCLDCSSSGVHDSWVRHFVEQVASTPANNKGGRTWTHYMTALMSSPSPVTARNECKAPSIARRTWRARSEAAWRASSAMDNQRNQQQRKKMYQSGIYISRKEKPLNEGHLLMNQLH